MTLSTVRASAGSSAQNFVAIILGLNFKLFF